MTVNRDVEQGRGTPSVDSNPVPADGGAPRPRAEPSWQRAFAGMVITSDLVIICATAAAAVLVDLRGEYVLDRARVLCGVLATVLVISGLVTTRAWSASVLGTGTEELKRLGQAVLGSSVTMSLAGLALMVESVRLWVFGVIPLIGMLCMIGRFVLRKWLHRQRRAGRCTVSVLAVGDHDAVAGLIARTRRDIAFGWRVDAVCTPLAGHDGDTIDGVPVHGDLDSVEKLALTGEYQVVAVSRASGWGPARLHRLAWQLENTDIDLAVDPGVMEIAGPRLHITPIDGMPLLRLSRPRFTGPGRLLKAVFDRLAAAVLLIATLPLFVGIALAVHFSDGGPVFFTQHRVGALGRPFRMLKFRSMCVDAEQQQLVLMTSNEGAGPLFKLRADPRVTRVGAVLRKFSLDELPQLLNVLTGSMSVVGPRPPLPSEVATYADDAQRRLLVRPGITGLWQVSGRSDLSWEESVRLDLRYVENWSLTLDALILWKTIGAVVKGHGAF